jgi:cell division protein FtsA
LNDLIKATEEAGVDVIDVIVAPLAASIVNLSKTQKIAGSVLANIGSETVSLLVYENNIPISLEVFPIGGSDITNDIALGFRIPIDEAENIKIGRDTGTQYSKKKLDEIIMNRLTEIFDKIEAHLKKIGRSSLLPAGIIITGGGSGISMVETAAKDLLKLPSKTASINVVSSIKDNHLKDPSWSVAYGLAVWGLNNGEDTSFELNASSNRMGGVFKKASGWLQQFLP